MLDMEHQNKFKTVWAKGDYRRGSTALRMLDFILNTIPYTMSINDYGCGTGRLEVAMMQTRPVQKITMIDITETALENEAMEFISNPITNLSFITADLQDLSQVPHADWGICINTLMTVQADKLDKILAEIKRTCKNLIVEMYDLSDKRLGMDLTTVKKNKIEWTEKLAEYWTDVAFQQSKESPHRYIFICKEAVSKE